MEPPNPAPVVDASEVRDAVWAKIVPSWAFPLLPDRAPKGPLYHRDYRDDPDRNTRVRDVVVASGLGMSNSTFPRVVCYTHHDAANNGKAEAIHRARGVADAA